MFSAVFMKILESRPRSYDRRMDAISRGRVGVMKRAVVEEVSSAAGARVLEIGCGTGELALMLAQLGTYVDGFDRSEAMVAMARERIVEGESGELEGALTFRRMGVDGMDELESGRYEAAVSTLVFSELTGDERRYALLHTHRVLKPGGQLVIADEVVPRTAMRRAAHALVRAPALVATFLISSDTTRPLSDLAGELVAAGFIIDREERIQGDALAIVSAHRPTETG